jgi:pyruvate/2-oxoglutarate dehydrogenase complex dihydrolipoamide dehydrogenase (E3) component
MYDLVVIGGGSGGLSVASAAAKVGAKVALVERQPGGGESALSACVSSKGLVQAARRLHQVRSGGTFGLKVGPVEVDFPAVMARARSLAEVLAHGSSDESLRARGIDVYRGSATFEAYDTVRVDAETAITGYRLVIATGSRPAIPAVPGLSEAGYLDDGSLWSLSSLPESLVIMGAGATAVEFAQCFARFGTKVTLVADAPRILPGEDDEAAGYVGDGLGGEGIELRLGVEIIKVEVRGDRKVCILREVATGATGEVAGSDLLLAAGRLARVDGLNLDAAGVHGDPEHGIAVDDYLQTHSARVYAIGDVLMRQQYAYAAEREAEVAYANAVLRRRKRMDYSTIPRVTFSDPEVAGVGMTEDRARDDQREHRVYRVPLAQVDRAQIDGRIDGFAKVVATPGGRVLGATIVGPEASLLIQEFTLAMEKGLGLGAIAAATAIYPTYAGIGPALARQHMATRLERGVVQTALRIFYGFMPRVAPGNGTAHDSAAGTAGHEPPAEQPVGGQGHGH